ncbi:MULTISPECIES: DUF397 domain-containing protein [Streptomyces]|uniref:DUF397 domain-containing protein n=1 Tax=Streptomyces TaxID=1883 RepID=UPI000CD50FDF|nr:MULTISPECIES: DUF397 domain-containing protein [unclassified Streptomyces]AWL38490.1 DUF397 domain-containing protein [Streptomyces sp. SM18]
MTDLSRAALSAAAWRRSSRSNQAGGDCVEVADGFSGVLPVRDSKRPQGPALVFGVLAWSAFVNEVKADRSA